MSLVLITGVLIAFAGFAFTVRAAGLTQAQIDAVVALLQSFGVEQATINNIQTTLGGTPSSVVPVIWCHNFNMNLGVGSGGDDACALRIALQREGFEIRDNSCRFGEEMASAVSGFQQKYVDEILKPLGLQYGTGYLGKSTRTKLNNLYGCGAKPLPSIPTPTCEVLLTCETGYRPYNTGSKDSQSCPIIKCVPLPKPVPVPVTVSEQVKCLFHNSTSMQECYSSAGVGCKGVDACIIDVKGAKGEQITWKSSCGGYAYTTMDENNEYAEFKCASVVCNELACPAGYKPYDTGEKDSNGCPIKKCIPIGTTCTQTACPSNCKTICPEGVDANGCPWLCKCDCPIINQPPIIHGVSGPTTLKIREVGTWIVKASDPEQGILSYSVRWGDEGITGAYSAAQKAWSYTQSAEFTHSYASAGTYNPTFTVTDNQGFSAKTSISVQIGEAQSTISEQVKCAFNGATTEQKCWGDVPSSTVGDIPNRFGCSGIGTCGVTISGQKGIPVTWGSSCGGSADTVIDGNNEYAEFNCAVNQ